MVLTMTKKSLRRLSVAATVTASAAVMAFGEVKGSGITLRVPVRVAEVEMKPCRTLVMWPSAGGVFLWTAAKAHFYGEGKCQDSIYMIGLKSLCTLFSKSTCYERCEIYTRGQKCFLKFYSI